MQQMALLGWTSVPWLPLLAQPTLVMAGDDDPVIPLVNAKLMAGLIRNSRLHVFHDGHLFLISNATEAGRVVRDFLTAPEGTLA
jgi:poly(3-hydroxyoctanoate) depolymerase